MSLNNSNEKHFVIIYHANCTDGFTAAWAAWKGLGNEAKEEDLQYTYKLFPMNYNNQTDLEDLCGYLNEEVEVAEIYIVDFSLPIDTLKLLAKQVDSITVLDHHKTAFEMYCGTDYVVKKDSKEELTFTNAGKNIYIYLDNNESGASLTWNHFFGPLNSITEFPMLIAYVRDHDLWRHSLNLSKAVNKYIVLQSHTLSTWESLAYDLDNRLGEIQVIAVSIQKYHTKIVENCIEGNELPISLNGEVGLACYAPYILASDVGHELAVKSNTYGAVLRQKVGNIMEVSLRSNGDYDVSTIAKKFGGGGHKNAAGFTMGLETIVEDRINIWNIEEQKE